MPSSNYRDSLLERLVDPEYASEYLEMVFGEALEDGYIDAFPLALQDVIEAAKNRSDVASEIDILRQRLYQLIAKQEKLTLEDAIAALKEVGLTYKMKPVENTCISSAI